MLNFSNISNFKNLFLELFDSKYFIFLYITSLILILGMEYLQGNYFSSEWIFVLVIGVIGIVLTIYSFLSIDKLHRIAFVIILLFGLLAVFYYPILSLPDEAEHFGRSELISHGDLFVQGYDDEGYKTIKSTTFLFNHSYDISFNKSLINEKIDYSLAHIPSVFAQNLFYCYVPQALGILIAKLLDLNTIWLLWLGRLCNLVVYACICSFSIRKAPFFKLQLFIVACLPLSIQQAASMSSDAMFISLGLLTLAYFFYLYAKDDANLVFKEIGIFFILSLLVALIKPPFIMFSMLILLIPKSKFKSKKEYKTIYVGLILVFLVVLTINVLYSVPQLNNSARQDIYAQFGINAKDQLIFMLNNPIQSILMILSPNFLWIVFSRIFYFGDFMSVYNTFFISKTLILAFILYYVALLCYSDGNLKIDKKTKFYIFIIGYIIFLGVLFVQYLTWSPVGENFIHGLQGRYILPILALIPLSFSFKPNFSFLNDNKKELDLIFVVLMIVFLSSVFILLIYFYYMSGQYDGMAIPNTSNIF